MDRRGRGWVRQKPTKFRRLDGRGRSCVPGGVQDGLQCGCLRCKCVKKLLVIGLVVLMGLRLAACGGSESTGDSSAKSTPETAAEGKPAAAERPEMADR